ncbi:MAG: dihydroorotate dehydrogenase, partial [Gaiellales bacterium]
LVNTARGMALDARTLEPRLATGTGGLSGPALRPVALAAVFACAAVTDAPIVAVGGISEARHALQFVAAGASDVALGTALFAEPRGAERVRAELCDELRTLGFSSIDNVRGLAHRIPSSIPDGTRAEKAGDSQRVAVSRAISP